jgi:uncharacterized protein YcaQ
MTLVYPLAALRAFALHSLKLDAPNGSEPSPSLDAVYETVNQLGAVQIDTLQMVARAHYLTIWSRHGNYDPTMLDRLAFDPTDRRTFEGWYHAACYLPTHEYRYQMPRQRKTREGGHQWYAKWIENPANQALIASVRERIQTEGGLRTSAFDNPEAQRGSWWDWKPAKIALEYLFAYGDLMIADRPKFQRVYDLTERVLPGWADQTEPTPQERDRFWVERGAKALGVSLPRNPGDYTWMGIGKSRKIVADLVKEGVLIEVQGETLTGHHQTLIVHRDQLQGLQRAASGEICPQRTTFLNPWDNFWWAQNRDEALWGFRHTIEAYVPAPKRVYGYYSMPILHKDRLVGRFDPKLERAAKRLRIKALHLEPGFAPTDELTHAVAIAMRDFMAFNKASDLVIETSNPPEFAVKLMQML